MKEWNWCKNYLDFNIILIPGLFFAKKYAMDQLQTSPTKKLHKKNHSPAPPTTAVFWHGLAFQQHAWNFVVSAWRNDEAENRWKLPDFRNVFNICLLKLWENLQDSWIFHTLGLHEEKEMHESSWDCVDSWSFYVFLLNSLVTRASQARAYLVPTFEHEMKPKMNSTKKTIDWFPLVQAKKTTQRFWLSRSFLSQFHIWQMLKNIKQLAFKVIVIAFKVLKIMGVFIHFA